MMVYAPRALRHFSFAAMERRAERAAAASRSPPPTATPPREVSPAPRRTVVRLWLPLTAIFLLLAPFALLLTPLLCFAPAPYRARPLAVVLGVGRLLLSLGGTVVHVDTPEALVSLKIF